jgi:DNA mismatch repair protein MutL
VRDRTIAHAIQQAYSTATIKERSPEVHLFVELPAERVDVNVHPTKAEVRFLDQSLVHEVLRRALIDALGGTGAPELRLAAPQAASAVPATAPLPLGFGAAAAGPDRWIQPSAGQSFAPAGAGVTTMPPTGIPELLRPMVPLGQFRQTFIIAADDDGLVIVDQHVAHERILFEQIAERLTSRTIESQRLLAPIVVELGPGAHQTLIQHAATLAEFGFELEDFGGTSLAVAAVPALLELGRSEAALRALASDLDGLAPGAGVADALRRLAATMACHAAVKAHDVLTREKMQYLLDGLRATAHSSVCPHGRPVVLRLTRREIEKSFERI